MQALESREDVEGPGWVGLATFQKYTLTLADKWFDLGGLSHLLTGGDVETLGLCEGYVLDSGTYGSVVHSVARGVGHEASVKNKVRFLLSRFFLPYSCACGWVRFAILWGDAWKWLRSGFVETFEPMRIADRHGLALYNDGVHL